MFLLCMYEILARKSVVCCLHDIAISVKSYANINYLIIFIRTNAEYNEYNIMI
jgi:hypothetical protein